MSEELERLIANMRRIESVATAREANPDIEGLHLVAITMGPNKEDPRRVIDMPIGNVRSPYGGPEGVAFYATVKAFSTFLANQRDPSIITSHQIADPQNHLYGGAVVFPGGLVVAASAYKDQRDALAVVRGGLISGLCDVPYAEEVLRNIPDSSGGIDLDAEWKALAEIK